MGMPGKGGLFFFLSERENPRVSHVGPKEANGYHGMASVHRIDEIIGLFCQKAL